MNLKTSDASSFAKSAIKRSLDVGVIQFKGDRAAYEESQDRLIDAIESAGEHGVKILVCPECACSEYCFDSKEDALPYSETLDGQFADRVSLITRQYHFWCFVGVVERDHEQRLFNTVFTFDPSGSRYRYRKRLLFDADNTWAESGDVHPAELPVTITLDPTRRGALLHDSRPPYPIFDVFGWRTTVGICMDLNDPRFIDFCEQAEVELIAFPTNWIDQGYDVIPYWAHVLRDVNRATLLAANSYGEDGPFCLRGRSAILQADPPTLFGLAPASGDYLITCQLEYPSLQPVKERREEL